MHILKYNTNFSVFGFSLTNQMKYISYQLRNMPTWIMGKAGLLKFTQHTKIESIAKSASCWVSIGIALTQTKL